MNTIKVDYLIIGGGILGLTTAFNLGQIVDKSKTIVILESRSRCGTKASGNNTGVIHSGLFYNTESSKLLMSLRGGILLKKYCVDRGITLQPSGKLILAKDQEDLVEYEHRANYSNIRHQKLTPRELSLFDQELQGHSALYLPDVCNIEPNDVITSLVRDVKSRQNTKILCNEAFVNYIGSNTIITSSKLVFCFNHLFNTSGESSTQISRYFGFVKPYILVPVEGRYFSIGDNILTSKTNLYPIQDKSSPFLPIHVTYSERYGYLAGPTAHPLFLADSRLIQEILTATTLLKQTNSYFSYDKDTVKYILTNITMSSKVNVYNSLRTLIPRLNYQDISRSPKRGVRAQNLDISSGKLVNDFELFMTDTSTHFINPISPGFTSAFALTEYAINQSKACNY